MIKASLPSDLTCKNTEWGHSTWETGSAEDGMEEEE